MLKNKKPQKPACLIIWLENKHLLNSQAQERGNTLVIALATGLLVLGATSLALLSSTKDKTNAQAGQYTKQVVATAETGVTRTVEKLNSDYPYYLTLNYDPINTVNEWVNPPSGSNVSPCAPNSSDLQTAVIEETLSANTSYQIQSYTYNLATQKGTLSLKGQKNDGTLNSQAQLQVGMNITQLIPPGNFPGLYGEEIVALDAANIDTTPTSGNAVVICTDCTSSEPANCTNGEPSIAYLEDALKLDNGGSINGGKMIVGLPKLPDLPPVPTTACSSTVAPPDCYILIPAITTNIILPRPIDITNRTTWGHSLSEAYNYVVDKNGANRSLHNANLTVDTTTNSTSVRMYLTGHFNQSGTSSTIHNGTLEKLALFGCTDDLNSLDINGNSIDDTCISPMTNQQIELNGGALALDAFIYAPYAQAGINGGASSPDLRAVVWTRTWGKDGSSGVGSNSSNVEMLIPENAQSLLSSEFGSAFSTVGVPYNRIDSITTWNRTKAN